MILWRCGICGYIHDGDQPNEKCPNCGAPGERFERLPDDRSQLVTRSRFTNDLHVQLQGLLEEIMEVARMGIEDNLDPRCLEIFTQAKELAWMLRQRSKAEVQAHIGKGKWG